MNKLIIATTKVPLTESSNIIKINSDPEDSIFKDITKCGLAMEELFLEGNRSLLWKNDPSHNIAAIVWGDHLLRLLDPTLEKWANRNIRGDELIFHSLDMNEFRHWVIGHPRALIKWASCVTHIEHIDHHVFPQHSDHPEARPTSRLIWLAHRIGLKIYGSE
jgi:hypothetical protein